MAEANVVLLLDQIEALIEARKLNRAIKQLNDLPKKVKKRWRYTLLMAQVFILKADFIQAEQVLLLNAPESNYSQEWRFYQCLCELYFQWRRKNKLLTALEKLNALRPPLNVKMLQQLVDYYEFLQDYPSLIKTVELGLKKQLGFKPNEVFLKAVLMQHSDNQALEYLLTLHELYPHNVGIEAVLFKFIKHSDAGTIPQLIQSYGSRFNSALILKLQYLYPHIFTQESKKQSSQVNENSLPSEVIAAIRDFIYQDDMASAKSLLKYLSEGQRLNFAPFLTHLPDKSSFARPVLDEDIKASVQVVQADNAVGTVIVFTGLADQIASMPLAIIDRYFAVLNLNAIYLRDFQRQMYLNGIQELGNNLDETISELSVLLGEMQHKPVFTFSTSAGGMGAVRYGLRLKAQAALCFSPPYNLLYSQETRAQLIIKRMAQVFTSDDLSLETDLRHNKNMRVDVYFATEMKLDRMQAQGFRNFEQVTLHRLKGCAEHNILAYLASRCNLMDLIANHYQLKTRA